jgi:tetratricopeptide (TPR) repeat protein
MVEALAGEHSLPGDLARRIVDHSDGVPLYIEELARSVLDEISAGASDPMTGDLSVPNSLQSSLVARLDRLSSAKRVAQIASTLGREFDYPLLEHVGEVDPSALRLGLRQLVEADILYEHGSPPTATYQFRHALLKDTAYRLQLPSDRRKAHARIAESLEADFADRVASEPEVAAHHCAKAGLHERAATHYQAAGTLSAQRYANEEALRYLDEALAELGRLPATPDRHQRELETQLARTLPLIALRGFDHPEVAELYRTIERLVRDLGSGPGQVSALLALAQYHQRRGSLKEATIVGETILEIARDAGIPVLEVAARLIVGSNEITTAPLSRAIPDLERALEVANSTEMPSPTSPLQPELQCFIHSVLSVGLAIAGRPGDAERQARAARARAIAIDHEPTLVQVLALCTITLNLFEDWETTLEWGRESLELAEGGGFHNAEAEARTNVGWARVALGDPGGLEDVEAGVEAAMRSGFKGGLCEYFEAAASAARLAGRFERAHEMLDRARETYEATGEAICFEGRGHRLRAMTYLGEGRPDEARAEFERAYPLLERYGARVEMLMAATELLRLARGSADEAAARGRLARLYASFDPTLDYRPLRAAAALLEEVAADTEPSGVRRLVE